MIIKGQSRCLQTLDSSFLMNTQPTQLFLSFHLQHKSAVDLSPSCFIRKTIIFRLFNKVHLGLLGVPC